PTNRFIQLYTNTSNPVPPIHSSSPQPPQTAESISLYPPPRFSKAFESCSPHTASHPRSSTAPRPAPACAPRSATSAAWQKTSSPPAQPASPDSSPENPPQTPHPIPGTGAYPDTPAQCSIQN